MFEVSKGSWNYSYIRVEIFVWLGVSVVYIAASGLQFLGYIMFHLNLKYGFFQKLINSFVSAARVPITGEL